MALIDRTFRDQVVGTGRVIGMAALTLVGLAFSAGLSLFWLAHAGLAITEASLRVAISGWAAVSLVACGSLLWYVIKRRTYRLLLLLVALPFALANIVVPVALRFGQ